MHIEKPFNNNPELEENKQLISIIKANALPIEYIEKYTKDKDIIGIGEATHGTKEFQNIKLDIVSVLIKKSGLKNIILEESFSHCIKINNYTLGGEGKPEEVIKEGLSFSWVFKTREILNLIKWLKEYNDTVTLDEKVRFYGMDFQGVNKVTYLLEEYLKKVDYISYNVMKGDFKFLKNENNKLEASQNKINYIQSIFIANKEKYIIESSEMEYDEIYHYILVYKQWLYYNENGMQFNIRDKFMFENVNWIINNSKKYRSGKTAILAHNDHIQKGRYYNQEKDIQLGYLLSRKYGEKYYSVGLEFSRGSFYSFDMMDNYKLKIFEVDKGKKMNLAARLFEETQMDTFYLDFKSAEKDCIFNDFITSLNRYNSIGAVYDESKEKFGVDELVLKDMYDAIVYFRNTSNTTLLG